jgi:hypothetical protein
LRVFCRSGLSFPLAVDALTAGWKPLWVSEREGSKCAQLMFPLCRSGRRTCKFQTLQQIINSAGVDGVEFWHIMHSLQLLSSCLNAISSPEGLAALQLSKPRIARFPKVHGMKIIYWVPRARLLGLIWRMWSDTQKTQCVRNTTWLNSTQWYIYYRWCYYYVVAWEPSDCEWWGA